MVTGHFAYWTVRERLWSRQCSCQLAPVIPDRPTAERLARPTHVQHVAVPVWCATGIRTRTAALYCEHVAPLGGLIESFSVSYHQFADDTQLFITMNVLDAVLALNCLADCLSALRLWFLRNGLQLNADKSEVVILGTSHQLRAAANIQTIDVAGSWLAISDRVKSLGIFIDSHLRVDCHASNVARACNYYTRALRHVRSLLSDEVAQTVAYSIVASWLDYCTGNFGTVTTLAIG